MQLLDKVVDVPVVLVIDMVVHSLSKVVHLAAVCDDREVADTALRNCGGTQALVAWRWTRRRATAFRPEVGAHHTQVMGSSRFVSETTHS